MQSGFGTSHSRKQISLSCWQHLELNERVKNNRLSLNETTRRTERAKNIKQREKKEADRRNAEQGDRSKTYELNLAHVNKRQLPLSQT
jgi:hypothetical protein